MHHKDAPQGYRSSINTGKSAAFGRIFSTAIGEGQKSLLYKHNRKKTGDNTGVNSKRPLTLRRPVRPLTDH